MPIFWSSDNHRMHQDCLIKIWWILLWRTQNPTITRYLWIWGHSPKYGSLHSQSPTICTKNNSTTLKVVLRLELKVWKYLFWSEIKSVRKWPQSSLKRQNAIFVWYLNENGQTWDIWGYISLKSPQNCFKFLLPIMPKKQAVFFILWYKAFL